MLTKLLCSAMVWKAFIFQAYTCKLILTYSSPFFFSFPFSFLLPPVSLHDASSLFCFFAELCASVVLVGQKNKHLVSGKSILDLSQGIGRPV